MRQRVPVDEEPAGVPRERLVASVVALKRRRAALAASPAALLLELRLHFLPRDGFAGKSNHLGLPSRL